MDFAVYKNHDYHTANSRIGGTNCKGISSPTCNPLWLSCLGHGTGEYSDVDLLVILPFEGKNFHKSLEILNYLNIHLPIDLLARRPDDVQRRYAEGDPLIREALNHGKVLYAQ
jgi:hypothetical protein